jgi:2-phospho-L-lactate guanylyltransferase
VLAPLVPVKRLDDAKGRLAPELGPIERRLVAIAMLEDVLAAVAAADAQATAVVVSPDREVWRRAEALGCRVVEEPDGGDLNTALRLAAGAAGAVGGADGLLVVAADLPLAEPSALARVAGALEGAPVVVVPSADGAGTNVLGWRDPAAFEPRFGPGSAARHLAVDGAVRVDEPTLAADVDTAADLAAALGRLAPGSVTARRAQDLKLAAKLAGVGDEQTRSRR